MALASKLLQGLCIILLLLAPQLAWAEERPNQLLTFLTSTTISGSVDVGNLNWEVRPLPGVYLGSVRFPHRTFLFGCGATTNAITGCAFATDDFRVLGSSTVINRRNERVRGKIPGLGYFSGKVTNQGQQIRGYFVFTKNGTHRTFAKRFVLEHAEP